MFHAAALPMLLALLAGGCAGTSSSAVTGSAATATTGSPARLLLAVSQPPPEPGKPTVALAPDFAAQLARKLGEDGIPVVLVPDGAGVGAPQPGTVLARCMLFNIRTGNQALRLAVGFGAGRATLAAHVELVDLRGNAPTPLVAWDTRSSTGALPGPVLGMIPPVAAGQAAGIVGGSAGVLLGATDTMRKEIDHSTTAVAERLETQFERLGWQALSPRARSVMQAAASPAPAPVPAPVPDPGSR